jgi:SHS2 domain-containing protein
LRFRTIEHTADIGIEVEADNLADLFAGAAEGMYSIIIAPGVVSPAVSRSITLEANDLEELMFEWLNELLYLLDAKELLLSIFEIARIERFHLEATVSGEKIDQGRHRLLGEIKAATYHQMTVERRDDSWFARIIFDV